ncbi:hypothetical protein, partial [Neisseria elongata]|uniref:hypothetical protein n=1 Tax=Neisseria elongata TaxID=495 RepID=UPI00360F7D01
FPVGVPDSNKPLLEIVRVYFCLLKSINCIQYCSVDLSLQSFRVIRFLFVFGYDCIGFASAIALGG